MTGWWTVNRLAVQRTAWLKVRANRGYVRVSAGGSRGVQTMSSPNSASRKTAIASVTLQTKLLLELRRECGRRGCSLRLHTDRTVQPILDWARGDVELAADAVELRPRWVSEILGERV